MDIVPQNVAELWKLLGRFVPLPCNVGNGGKGAILRRWQELSLHDVSPAHVAQCERAEYRIGVSLGRPSHGLCCLDCDCDEFAAALEGLNPILRSTLTTTCNRGCTYWLRMSAAYPPNAGLEWFGVKRGEWRATGNLSVIAGRDTDTGKYRRFVVRACPIALDFDSFVWPDRVSSHGRPWPSSERESIIDVEQSAPHPHPCSTSKSKAEEERSEKEWRFYKDLVAHLPGKGGERNALLVRAAPFLCHAVCPTLAIALLMRHFDTIGKPGGWSEARKEHLKSVKGLVLGCVERYVARLPESERGVYGRFDDEHRTAYRILRDCAKRDDPARGCPPGLFIMAYGELAARLRCSNARAVAITRNIGTAGIITVDVPGIQRAKGVAGVATRWRWLLPL